MAQIAQYLAEARKLNLNPATVWIARLYTDLAYEMMDEWASGRCITISMS